MKTGEATVSIKPPNMQQVEMQILGTAPLVINAFPKKAREMIKATQAAGSTARSKKARVARDFERDFQEAHHKSEEGWDGIPAPAFRAAAISACRLVGFKMTLAKMSVFILAEGLDALDGTPLVKIIGPAPELAQHIGRNTTGVVDLRIRPMWRKWGAVITIRYDADQFQQGDVMALFSRVGEQVGIGEGRPDSRNSTGMGWGTFRILESGENLLELVGLESKRRAKVA